MGHESARRHAGMVLVCLLAAGILIGCGGEGGQSTTPPPPPPPPPPPGISQPTVTSVSPSNGSTAGGVQITVRGTNFLTGAALLLDGAPASSVVVADSTTIRAVTPRQSAGPADVEVRNTDQGTGRLSGAFRYDAPQQVATATVFQDGFESGNGSAFDFIGNVLDSYMNQASFCRSGNFCGQQTLQPNQNQVETFWDKSLAASGGAPLTAYYMGWWKFPSDWRWNTSDVDHKAIILEGGAPGKSRVFVNFRSEDSATSARVAVLSERGPDQFFHYNQGGSEPLVQADGTWHSVELFVDQPNGHIRVWLDGNLHIDMLLFIGTDRPQEVKFGAYMGGAAAAAGGGPRSFYMDDIAISTSRIGADSVGGSTLVFADDFEAGNWSKWGGTRLSLSNGIARGGSHAAVSVHTVGSLNEQWAETYFADYENQAAKQEDVEAEFDVMFDAAAEVRTQGGQGTKLAILIANDDWNSAYAEPLSFAPFYLTVFARPDFTLGAELRRKTSEPVWVGFDQNVGSGSAKLTPGAWQRVKVRAKLNTPGQNDGVLEISLDGTVVMRHTDVNFRDSYTGKGWNMLELTGTDNASPTRAWSQYWDNVTVRDRIP